MSEKKHFEIIGEMARKNKDITACPDMVSANAGKSNGTITMGVPANVVHKMLANPDRYYTQLLIINMDEYEAIRKESAKPTGAPFLGTATAEQTGGDDANSN
jgi:hypothetical protein